MKKFEYCDHNPEEYMCPNCGECILCTCDCERANMNIGDRIMVAIDEGTTVEATITGENDDVLSIMAIDDDFYGYGTMQIGRYDRSWWKP